ncbi:MAG: hypothetical protein ACE5KO_00025 [Candidatus Bathyarchaeia archaeon]
MKYNAAGEFRPSETGLNVSSMIIMAAIVALAQNASFGWAIAILFAGMTCFGYYLVGKAKKSYEEWRFMIPAIVFGVVAYVIFLPLAYGLF